MEPGAKELRGTKLPGHRRAVALILVHSFPVLIAPSIADPNLPDFSTKTDATLDNYARFRIVSTNKFAP